MSVLHCTENGSVFPEFFRVIDLGKGMVEITLSEQGLHSPVSKVRMTKNAAAMMLHNAAYAVENGSSAEEDQ